MACCEFIIIITWWVAMGIHSTLIIRMNLDTPVSYACILVFSILLDYDQSDIANIDSIYSAINTPTVKLQWSLGIAGPALPGQQHRTNWGRRTPLECKLRDFWRATIRFRLRVASDCGGCSWITLRDTDYLGYLSPNMNGEFGCRDRLIEYNPQLG